MYRGKRISVVIPCHNEEDGIAAVLDQMPPIVDEVVVVDNCSTDDTAKVATERGARVVSEKRKGYGFAHKAGYAAARGDIIVTMDGDGTYPPDSVPLLLYVMLEEKVDFITARRWYSKNGETKSPIRLLGNAILSGAMMCSLFPLHHRLAVGHVGVQEGHPRGPRPHQRRHGALRGDQDRGVHASRACAAIEMPIYYGERIGESKLNIWSDGFYNLFFLLKKRFMLRKKQPRLRVRRAASSGRGRGRVRAPRRAASASSSRVALPIAHGTVGYVAASSRRPHATRFDGLGARARLHGDRATCPTSTFCSGSSLGRPGEFHRGVHATRCSRRVVFGAAAGLCRARWRSRRSLASGGPGVRRRVYASHLLVDALTIDVARPGGRPVLLAALRRLLHSPVTVFHGDHHRRRTRVPDFCSTVLAWRTVSSLVREMLIATRDRRRRRLPVAVAAR